MGERQGIAIAVPTLNEAAGIETVIAELLRGLPDARETRLYVADGGSRDATRAIVEAIAARDPRVILLHNPARLQSAGVNRVADVAAGWAGVLLRCDAHAGYPDGYVARLVASLERSGADSVVVPMDSVGSTCAARATAWVSDTPAGSGGSAHRGGRRSGWVDHGHHAAWRLDAFRRVGGYDESYSHNEDAELDCRLLRSGARIWLDADIRLTYRVRTSFSALWRQYRGYGRGRSRTVRRHPGSMRPRQLVVPAFVGANALALAAGLWWRWALLLPAAYLGVLALISVQVAWKRGSACGLLAGWAALVMHVAWASGFAGGMVTVREPRWRGSETAA